MRLHHFLFWVLTTIGVSSFDRNLQNQTRIFIKDRLIPALRQQGIRSLNFNTLKLCLCSGEVGCVARTSGWIANLDGGLTSKEKELYKNTCFTDGICYQNSHTKAVADYGCIDKNRKELDTHFHDASSKVCQNATVGKGKMAWICCQNSHFCANSTNLIAEQSAVGSVEYWTVLLTLIIVVSFIIILMLNGNPLTAAKNLARKCQKNKIVGKYEKHESEVDSIRLSETSDRVKLIASDYGQATTEQPRPEQLNTVSTLMSESPNLAVPPHIDAVEFSPQSKQFIKAVNKFLDFIDETSSGSGQRVGEGGLGRLQRKTLAEQIILGGPIGEGRFGKVLVGQLEEKRVAIKIIESKHEVDFEKEVAILRHPNLRHKHFLFYYGATRKSLSSVIENWIITDYHQKGSLYEYLLNNTVDLETFFKMMSSIVEALKYLHNERAEDTQVLTTNFIGSQRSDWKPKMAHRDIKSRNILVKDDNSCCLGDFGLTIVAPKEGPIPESIVQNFRCGTVRYLAPEILNGSMESHTFDSFIMADIYSFSLVMWETLARTDHQEIVARQPEMAVPYVEWTDRCPEDETMKKVVCTKNLRPSNGELWSQNEDFKPLLEIMSICWSSNPSARYTAANLSKKIQFLQQEYLERLDPSLKEARLKFEEEVAMWTQKHLEEEEARRNGAVSIEYRQVAIDLKLDLDD